MTAKTAGKSTSKAAATAKAKNVETATRKQYAWTDEQITFLIDRPSAPRKQLVEDFRTEFKVSAKDLSDVAIGGRRYTLFNKTQTASPARQVAIFTAKIADFDEQIKAAKAALVAAKKAAKAAEAK